MAVSAPARATPWGSRVGGRGMWTWCPPRHRLSRFAVCGSRPGRYCTGDATCRNVPSTQHPGTRELLPLCSCLSAVSRTHTRPCPCSIFAKSSLWLEGGAWSVERWEPPAGPSAGGGACIGHIPVPSLVGARGEAQFALNEKNPCVYTEASPRHRTVCPGSLGSGGEALAGSQLSCGHCHLAAIMVQASNPTVRPADPSS